MKKRVVCAISGRRLETESSRSLDQGQPRRSNPHVGTLMLVALFLLLMAVGPGSSTQPTDNETSISGFIQLAESKFELSDAVAFRSTRLERWPDVNVVVVVLTTEAIDTDQVVSSVQETGNWEAPRMTTRLILHFDDDGAVLGGVSLGSGEAVGSFQVTVDPPAVESDVMVSQDEVRGKVALSQKGRYFGMDYTIDVESGQGS